jgi:threonylcarbamoyladenosine tRNA methylthiotransferase MtaB
MPHLHLPLQSGSPGVLKRMLRKTTPESFRVLILASRAVIPDLAITTDVIAGFPGESEAEFEETLAFVREMSFSGGHVFTYSARPGTPAARMRNQVAPDVKKHRAASLRAVFAEMAANYRRRFIGRTMQVLWEGHTDNFIRVTAKTAWPRWNQVDPVQLTSEADEGLRGELKAA